MNLTKILASKTLILLLPIIMGFSKGDCNFLIAIFQITLQPLPEPVDYNDIDQYHSEGYILAADNGRIYYSDNRGHPPESLHVVQGNPDLSDIWWEPQKNIIVGSNGTILRSTRSNPQWVLVSSPVTYNLNKIYECYFPFITYIVGDNGTILKSVDDGISWNVVAFPYSDNLRDIEIVIGSDCTDIIVSGDNYALYRSTDSGENWFPIGPGLDKPSGLQQSYSRIYFYDEMLGFVGGPNGLILKTTDGGWNWSTKVAQGFQQITDLYFISPDTGAAVGTNGTARFTTDGGNTWFEDPDVTDYLDGREVKRIFALSRNYGFVVGDAGLSTFIAKDSTYLDSAFTVTSIEEINLPIKEFKLFQNYPNPFNPVTVISYKIAVDSYVQLKVFDILGREVATLVDEERNSGFYNVEFDASGLSAGIYFYQLKAGSEFIDSKKLVLLK